MKNEREIRAQIDQLNAEVSAIVDLCTAEDRDFTPQEKATVDRIQGIGNEAGEIHGLKDDLEREIRRSSAFNARAIEKMKNIDWDHPEGPRMRNEESTPCNWRSDAKGNKYAVLNKHQKATDVYRPKCEDELSRFVLAKVFGPTHRTPDSIKNALSSNSNEAGGFLVPNEYSSQIIDLQRSKSVLGQAGMTAIMMQSGQLTIPALVENIEVSTKGENSPFAESTMQFSARMLNARTCGCFVKLSREMFEDAEELLAQQLTSFMASEMARQVDEWGLAGEATATEPMGLLTRATLTDSTKVASTGSIGTLDWVDLAAAATAVRNRNHEPNAVIINTGTNDALGLIETGDGTNAARGWLGRPETLANVQFLSSTHCPSDQLVIGDFSKYAMGMRLGTRIEVSSEAGTAFEDHQVWIKIFSRIDFVPLDVSAFHALTGIS